MTRAFVIANLPSPTTPGRTLFFSVKRMDLWPDGNWQNSIRESLCFLRQSDAKDFIQSFNLHGKSRIEGFVTEVEYTEETTIDCQNASITVE